MNNTKLKREDIVKAISGILIVLAFVAVISLIANLSSNTSNSNSSGNTDNGSSTTYYTIEAGTYVFNEIIFEGPKTCETYFEFYSGGVLFNGIFIDLLSAQEIRYLKQDSLYEPAYIYYDFNPVWISKDYRTINIIEDTEVSEDFYNWFYENTEHNTISDIDS